MDTLRAVDALKDSQGRVVVTIAGDRAELEGADRALVDQFPNCGPIGGIETALRDLIENERGINAPESKGDFAFFLPVDMPFLPVELIDALLKEWSAAANRGARVCYVTVDGRAQPLVSMVHSSLHRFVVEAITVRQYKVTPVLEHAAGALAPRTTSGIGFLTSALHTTRVNLKAPRPPADGRTAEEGDGLRDLWFSNLNSEEDFLLAEHSALSRV